MTATLLKTLEKQWKNMTRGEFKLVEKHQESKIEETRPKLKKKEFNMAK